MATREEIRERIASLCSKGMRDCDYDCKSCEALTDLLKDISNKGVVIKVNGELPSVFDINEGVISALEYRKKLAGYVAVESLVKES